jgi:hypothetical protein
MSSHSTSLPPLEPLDEVEDVEPPDDVDDVEPPDDVDEVDDVEPPDDVELLDDDVDPLDDALDALLLLELLELLEDLPGSGVLGRLLFSFPFVGVAPPLVSGTFVAPSAHANNAPPTPTTTMAYSENRLDIAPVHYPRVT